MGIFKGKITNPRKVQLALGLIWFLDGLLQLQHQMFSSNFATQVIAPAAQGQPGFVVGPMNFGEHLFLLHPAIFNSLFAATQLAIGILILYKRSVRAGLILSVFWGLIVWIFGEGYGGIFSGHTLLLMGAPGAVIIYVILALAVMPTKKETKRSQRPHIAYWLAIVWLILWVGGGVYQLMPGQNSISDLSSMVAGMSSGAPKWLSSLDNKTAKKINGLGKTSTIKTQESSGMSMSMYMTPQQMAQMPTQTSTYNSGYVFISLFAAIQICVGVGVLKGGIVRKVAIGAGIVLSLIFWVIGQSLGGYFTGLATDPNAGPLFVLLGLAVLGINDLDKKLSEFGHRIERVLVGKPNLTKTSDNEAYIHL